jgi:CO/xanthine dehydrogenase Mo-binding subunit
MRAAAQVRDQVLDAASTELEISRDDLEIVDGVVRPVGAPDRGRSLAWFATRDGGMGGGIAEYEGHGRGAPSEGTPSAAAHLAHVRVDDQTSEVAVLGYVAIQDVGRAIAPALVEGQMQGAAVQAIGIALYEGMVHDEHGQLLTGSLLDYALPTAPGLPPIETIVLEVPAPSGPYGARGMAETAIVPGVAAVANAIAAASGVRVRELPVTQSRLWAALRDRDGAGASGGAPALTGR